MSTNCSGGYTCRNGSTNEETVQRTFLTDIDMDNENKGMERYRIK